MKYFITPLVLLNLFLVPSLYAQSNQAQLENRISEYSKRFPVSLSDDERNLLSERCALIQDRLADAITSVKQSTINRESSYSFIENRLYSIQGRFSNQQLDTSIIDLMLADYRFEVSNFKIQALTYSNILNDAVDQDCRVSPEKFKSTILAARASRESLRVSMLKIRELYYSSITNGFKSLESQIKESSGRQD